MVHEFFSFSFRAPTARLLSSKRYAKAGMAAATDKMAHSFSAPADRKGRTGATLSVFAWKNSQEVFEKQWKHFQQTPAIVCRNNGYVSALPSKQKRRSSKRVLFLFLF